MNPLFSNIVVANRMRSARPSYHPTFPPPPPPKAKQLFAPHAKVVVPLEYVMTVYETCHMHENKYEEYQRYGVDGEMVEKYLDMVLRWNHLLQKK